jgi:hypothetical protein
MGVNKPAVILTTAGLFLLSVSNTVIGLNIYILIGDPSPMAVPAKREELPKIMETQSFIVLYERAKKLNQLS